MVDASGSLRAGPCRRDSDPAAHPSTAKKPPRPSFPSTQRWGRRGSERSCFFLTFQQPNYTDKRATSKGPADHVCHKSAYVVGIADVLSFRDQIPDQSAGNARVDAEIRKRQ